jgi:CheY-like chemotaxis protein
MVTMLTTSCASPPARETAADRVVVVSKQSQLNGLLETVIAAGQYDIVFVESTEHAYSHIKRLAPRLIIVCLDIDDIDGFHVLSMLKLDPDTRLIPVITCTVMQGAEPTREDSPGQRAEDVFLEPPAVYMN